MSSIVNIFREITRLEFVKFKKGIIDRVRHGWERSKAKRWKM